MSAFVLLPPVAFIILIIAGLLFSYAVSGWAPANSNQDERKLESYACGQRNITHRVSPDYNQFFPIAFFFTVIHVLVLVIATAPRDALTLPLIYVAAGVLALIILFRR